MGEAIAYMFLSEKQEYNQYDGCDVKDCENQASWNVPVRGRLLGHHAAEEKKFCKPCVSKFLEQADEQGRMALFLMRPGVGKCEADS